MFHSSVSSRARFCEVALPVPLRKTFTYAIPPSLEDAVQPGCRVAVPFRNRSIVGVVVAISDSAPELSAAKAAGKSHIFQIKEIARVIDPLPALSPKQIELARWLASYYLAPPGDAFRAMLPPLTELRAQRVLQLTETGRARLDILSALENRGEQEITEQARLARTRGVIREHSYAPVTTSLPAASLSFAPSIACAAISP